MTLLKILTSLLFIVITTACATSFQKETSASAVQPHPLSSLGIEQQQQFVNAKLIAENAVRQRRFDVAANNYLIAARLINSTEFAEKAVLFAERTENYITALQAADFWNQIDPENRVALSWKILGLLRSHQTQPLQQNLKKLLKISKKSAPGQYLKLMENILIKAADPASLKQLELFAQQHPNEAEAWLVLARLHELMDKKMTAMVLIDKALSVTPKFAPALELKGLIYLRSGKISDAKKHFIKSVENNPDKNSLKLQLAQILYQENNYQQAQKLALEILDSEPTSGSARYLLAAVYFLEKKYAESEIQFLKLLERNYKLDTTYYFLGEINLEYEKKEIALQFFDAISGGRHLSNARINAAKILFENNQLQSALKRLRNVRTANQKEQILLAITEIEMIKKANSLEKYRDEIEQDFEKKPDNIFFFTRVLKIAKNNIQRKKLVNLSLTSAQSAQAYKALVEVAFSIISQAGDNLQAIKILDRYLKQFPKDLPLFYSRAMLKAALNDIPGMEKDLRHILNINPGYIDALNALGYSLADQNIELDKAFEMISIAFHQRSNSAAITDSMGWVLYRKGEYSESLKHLTNAWKLEPSAEVGAHFGEVLWFSDKKEQAKKIWQQALQLDPSNRVLLETLDRLKDD